MLAIFFGEDTTTYEIMLQYCIYTTQAFVILILLEFALIKDFQDLTKFLVIL